MFNVPIRVDPPLPAGKLDVSRSLQSRCPALIVSGRLPALGRADITLPQFSRLADVPASSRACPRSRAQGSGAGIRPSPCNESS
jgi:hypothetical protein